LTDREIEPILVTGNKTDDKIIALYKPYAKIVQNSDFDHWSALWIWNKIRMKILGRDFSLEHILAKNDIPVFSHLLTSVKKTKNIKTVSWIPDFQHLHLPEMFSRHEIAFRNRNYRDLADKSDIVMLSSYDALKDFRSFLPEYVHKVRVLHFVAQPNPSLYKTESGKTEMKFGIDKKYFFLPNQFWKHKNHMIVFEAIRILKAKKRDIFLVCSGIMDDYRNKRHVREIVGYVRSNNLNANIKLLGMIDRIELFCLMRNCISVLNPSLFEGWSTTVEEAKSLGKSLILSSIPVHREQDPPSSSYFDPFNPEELAELLWKKYHESEGGPDSVLEDAAKKSLPGRTVHFGKTYQNIITELIDDKNHI